MDTAAIPSALSYERAWPWNTRLSFKFERPPRRRLRQERLAFELPDAQQPNVEGLDIGSRSRRAEMKRRCQSLYCASGQFRISVLEV
jgi:hypothetical protein